MGMTVLHNLFSEVASHSSEGENISKEIHVLYENSLRGDMTSLAALKQFRYLGHDQVLEGKVIELVILASSVGSSQ